MKALSLLVGLAFAPALLAQTPAGIPSTPSEAATDASEARDDMRERTCIRYSGSRLTQIRNEQADAGERRGRSERNPRPRASCAPVAGRAYTREDIDRVGAFGLADALRLLDPSVN